MSSPRPRLTASHTGTPVPPPHVDGPAGAGAYVAPPATVVAPVPADRRAIAPDVARGLALLGIAIANSAIHLSGGTVGLGSRPVDASTLDRVVNGVVSLFVDRRTMPMFALLYGYGIGVVVRRRASAWVPWPACRADLLRRAGALIAFGAVHLVLLFEGDILAAYGLAGLLAVAFVRASDRALLITAALVLPLGGLLTGAMESLVLVVDSFGAQGALDVPATDSVGMALLVRITSGVFIAPLGAVIALPLILLGLWAARREILERPADHVRLLRRTALVGLAVSVVGAVPFASAVAGLRTPSAGDAFWSATAHLMTGAAGGVAFAALVGWVVAARGATTATLGPATRALRAVGARSLTCYLLQSVLFVLPLAPWAGGLGSSLGTAQVAAWALGVWLVTVAVAVALDAAGRRGPAEWLYRRMVYRRSPSAPVAPATA